MPYVIADLELRQPLPELVLGPEHDGALILLRIDGRPVHYSLHRLRQGARVGPDALARLIGRAAGHRLLEDAVRRELLDPVERQTVDLTVAVCTRDRPALLETCLRSLLELQAEDSVVPRRFSVLVVDNDPPNAATERLISSLPGVSYVREPRPGLDFARNRALAEADTEFVAFLDDDVTVDHGWLDGLEEAVAENPDVAVVTGLVLPQELATPAQISFERRGGFARDCNKVRYAGQRRLGNDLYPAGAGSFGAGCNMVLRADVAQALGGFDEALDTGPPLPGGGDLDIFYRVIRAGHPLVYEPRMLVFHRHRRDRRGLRRQYWSWGEGSMAFLAKAYRTDPGQRAKLRRMVGWSLRYEARVLAGSFDPRRPMSPDLALAEALGTAVGLAGSYARSSRRVRRIRIQNG